MLLPTSAKLLGVRIRRSTTPDCSSWKKTRPMKRESNVKNCTITCETNSQSLAAPTWHISVMVSSNTPPASSAPSPTSLTFHARDGSRSSRGFKLTTCFAICTKMGLLERPLQEKAQMNTLQVLFSQWRMWVFLDRLHFCHFFLIETHAIIFVALLGGNPLDCDLRPVCLSLGHCSPDGAHQRKSVDFG